ncbi:uncharacterized protein LOC141648506 [Silene latifolia]|uniref:uncharacterized protein LOC141648506 n=1 Tax=Silene latifolia TaxID=37657 RepID=UPI003D775F6A
MDMMRDLSLNVNDILDDQRLALYPIYDHFVRRGVIQPEGPHPSFYNYPSGGFPSSSSGYNAGTYGPGADYCGSDYGVEAFNGSYGGYGGYGGYGSYGGGLGSGRNIGEYVTPFQSGEPSCSGHQDGASGSSGGQAPKETKAWVVQGRKKGTPKLTTIVEEPEEFIFGIWDEYEVDRISFLLSGVFIVRFKNSKDQEAVLQHGHFLFENKPLIVRPWNSQDPLTKSEVKGIPKISGLIGDYVKSDEPTEARTRLGYARVLIDVPFDQPPPKEVKFLDEAGKMVVINVEFEWITILCKAFGGIGHIDNACKKPKPIHKPKQRVVQRWQPKVPVAKPMPKVPVAKVPSPKALVHRASTSSRTVTHYVSTPRVPGTSTGNSQLATPARAIIRLSRQELLDQGSNASMFGQYTFMDALNNATPKLATGSYFYLTMVYAFNGVHERKVLWSRLQDMCGKIQCPWLICGDFNTVLAPCELLRGNTTEEEMEDFQRCIDYCHMVDMPATGSLFTWNNKQEAATTVFSRLDRALVNHEWLDQRKEFYAHFHVEGCFDHTPCLIQRVCDMGQRKGSFKYFNMWTAAEQFLPCVTQAWGSRVAGTPMFRSDPTNPDLIGTEIAAAKDYQELQKACDSFLLQKSKATWISEGDNNSKVFHSYMKNRQARNKVLRIGTEQGMWLTDPRQIQQAFLSFYQTLLGETQIMKAVNAKVVQRGSICTEEHWAWLSMPVTNDEIKEALFQIPNHKAPGLDGYSSAFFKDAWSVVGEELCEVGKDFFIHGRLLKQINHTLDVIRLYNRAVVFPRCLIKVDLKKAYDSVNWLFLKHMLEALCFPDHFKHLIMECVSTASYSLVLNGETFGHFHGKKGLRQGDPLSPLLFTIAMEYLTRVLNFTTKVMDFRYHSLCGKLKLHHLIFADDLLMFSRGDQQSVMLLLRSFASFSAASGLEMNKSKSNIYFNGNPKGVKDQIIAKSGCVEGQLPFKYLGVPITAGKLGKKECQVLVEEIVERIRMFGARKCSYAGRLILVQSVLTSLYSYWANIFLLPKGDQICTPKVEGGLGIRNSFHWNLATIGKLVWWIYSKTDSPWVKLVHQLYLKGSPWSTYLPKSHLSGNWKAICRTRDTLSKGYINGTSLADPYGYNVHSGYQWIRHKEPKVGWAKLVWSNWAIPKHCFLNWLLMRNALNTKDRLYKIGIARMSSMYLWCLIRKQSFICSKAFLATTKCCKD